MSDVNLDESSFRALVDRLADAWRALDRKAAADCFIEDAIYMEPPDVQYFRGRSELEAYFSPLAPGTYLSVRGSWFDPNSQTGAVEFSFGVDDLPDADHGVAVVEVENGLISVWREYQTKGPADFEAFIATENKSWEWHAGNYP